MNLKLAADRDQLALAVQRAVQGLPQNPVTPVRAGILLRAGDDHAHLTCGDEDVTFIARVGVTVQEEGSCVLPGKLLAELIRYLPSMYNVVIDAEGNQAVVTCGKSSFTLSSRPGEDYPEWEFPPGPLCTLDGAVLAAGLRKVSAAASDDLPALSGVLMELRDGKLTLVATDKYKLGMLELRHGTETKIDTASPAYLPSKVAERFARACEGSASVGWDDSLVSLHSQGLLVIARQVAGNLPDWRKVMTGEHTWYPCDTAELTRAVRMASLAATDDRVELAFGDGDITVTAGGAIQVMESGYDGEPVTLAVGGRNLLAGLNSCGETVNLALSASTKPLFLDSDGLRWLVQTRREKI